MTAVRNRSDRERMLADTGQVVGPGETVDVPEWLADRLCEQTDVWEPANTNDEDSEES